MLNEEWEPFEKGVTEIRANQIRFNQGVGVVFFFPIISLSLLFWVMYVFVITFTRRQESIHNIKKISTS